MHTHCVGQVHFLSLYQRQYREFNGGVRERRLAFSIAEVGTYGFPVNLDLVMRNDVPPSSSHGSRSIAENRHAEMPADDTLEILLSTLCEMVSARVRTFTSGNFKRHLHERLYFSGGMDS